MITCFVNFQLENVLVKHVTAEGSNQCITYAKVNPVLHAEGWLQHMTSIADPTRGDWSQAFLTVW
jgi:hypothetical protein